MHLQRKLSFQIENDDYGFIIIERMIRKANQGEFLTLKLSEKQHVLILELKIIPLHCHSKPIILFIIGEQGDKWDLIDRVFIVNT